MERRVSVNYASDAGRFSGPDPANRAEDQDPEDLDLPGYQAAALPLEVGEELEAPIDADWSDQHQADRAVSHGPCLYLGQSGERCANPALPGGYCARHHPDAEVRWPGRSMTRVLVASIALVIILWPYVTDLVRLIIHFVAHFRAD